MHFRNGSCVFQDNTIFLSMLQYNHQKTNAKRSVIKMTYGYLNGFITNIGESIPSHVDELKNMLKKSMLNLFLPESI